MSPEEHTEAFRESLSACLASVQGRIVAEVAHVAEDLYRALEHELLELIAGRLEDLDSSSGMAATPKPEVSRVLTAEVDTLRRNLMATSDALVLLAQRTTGRPLQMTNQPPPQSNQFMSNPLGVLARHASHGSHSIHHPSFTAEEDALRPSHRTSDEASPKLRPHLGMLVKHSREDPEHHEEEHHEHHHEHLHLHLPHVHSPEDSEATTLRLVAESEETKDRSSGSGHGRSRTSVGPIEKTRLHEFVESSYFDNFFTLVIIANCITMGIEAHYQVVGDDHAGEMLAYGEYFFTLLFSIELLCRYKVFGWRYFTPYDKEGMMNFLDMMLVLVTGILFGVFVPILGFISGTDFSNGYFRYAAMLRNIRLLRLVHVLRKAVLLRDMFLMLRGLTDSLGTHVRGVQVACRKVSFGQRSHIVGQLHTSSPWKFVEDAWGIRDDGAGAGSNNCIRVRHETVCMPKRGQNLANKWFGDGCPWDFVTSCRYLSWSRNRCAEPPFIWSTVPTSRQPSLT